MAGAGRVRRHGHPEAGVAILTGLEWPVLAEDRAGCLAELAVAILTGLEWPVLDASACEFGTG